MGEIILFGNSGEVGPSNDEKMLLEVSQDLLVDSRMTLEDKKALSGTPHKISELLESLGCDISWIKISQSFNNSSLIIQ